MAKDHPVHGSGLLFSYAADRCADPDWLVVPDGSQPHAWRLLHAVSQGGGTRFSVGSSSRYLPGQIGDVANKAKEYQFEPLHKIYFYDAWRCQPELNRPDSLLHLPPAQGCCRRRPVTATRTSATEPASSQASGVLAEVSLTETDTEAGGNGTSPSAVPSPGSTDHAAASPISVGSSEDADNCSPDADTEPSLEETQVVTLTSMSEDETRRKKQRKQKAQTMMK